MYPRILLTFAVAVILCGCGQSSHSSAPPSLKTYRDPKLHFSFRYPAGWTVPRTGQQSSATNAYEVTIHAPRNGQEVKISVDNNLVQYLSIPEGKIANATSGPDTLHYHHLTVSGWPAIQIKRYNGTELDGIFTIANTHRLSFEVEMVGVSNGFPPNIMAGYRTIVRTLKLPF